jgi:predicted RNase H-like nuclease (RuvC/YqgF family)
VSVDRTFTHRSQFTDIVLPTDVTHLSPILADPNILSVANGSIRDAQAPEMQLLVYSCQLVAAINTLQAAQATNATLENEVQMLQLQLNRSAEVTATNHALREEILELQNREATQEKTVEPRRTRGGRSRQKLREEVIRLTAQLEAAGREQEALERMLRATRNHDRDVQCVELFLMGLETAAERAQLGGGVVDGDESGDRRRTTWNDFAARDL